MLIAWTALLGLVVGSFLNVVVYRVPAGASIAWPASHCPRCEEPIWRRDNLPLISYLLLGGRCRHCGKGIPAHYPIVEGLTGVLFGAAALRFEDPGQLALALALIAALMALAFTDLEQRLLPNRIVGPASLAGAALSLLGGTAAWWTYPLTALILGGLMLALAVAYPGGMGMGDVKMGAMLGLFLGPYAPVAVFLGALFGSVSYAALVAAGRLERGSALPFGTFMAFGGLVALFAGPQLWTVYSDLLGAA